MVVGIENSLRWVADCQVLGLGLTVNVVAGSTVDGEVGSLVNQRSGPRIGTNVVCVPETTTEVDNSEFIGI